MSEAGRPTKYSDDMIEQVDAYVRDCVEKRELPSVAGIALLLNVNRTTVYDWSNPESPRYNEAFSNTLERVLQTQEKITLNNALNNKWNPTIAKLVLANHGYYDKSQTDITSGGEKISYVIELEGGAKNE